MTTSPRPGVSTSTRAWRNAVFAVFTLNGFATAAWISRVPAIRDDLALDQSQVGFLIVGVSVGAIIGLLLSSHTVNWLGGRRTLLLTLIGQALGLVVVGIGASTLGLFAATFLGLAIFGFTSATCDVAMNVEGAAVERQLGRTVMPLFHASWSVGTVIGAGLGSVAAFAGLPVLLHLGVVAVLVVIADPLIVRAVPAHAVDATGEKAAKSTFRDRMSIWLEPRTLLIGVIMLGMAFAEGSANDWLALAMVDDRGLDHGQGALLFGVFTVAMTAGRIGGVPALDRFGRVPVLRVAAATAIVGLVLVIFVDSIAVTVIGIVLWGIGASLGFPVGMSAAADDPAKAAARVSAVATVGYCAFLVGPPIIGIIGHEVGLLNALILVLVLIVLAALATPAAREGGLRRSAAPASDPDPAHAER
jgi:MFS family permease